MKAPKLELVDIDSLEPHAENPNQGDIGTICDLIVHNGWFGQTLVQTRDGLPDRVFVGEHRWRALKLLQAQGGVVRENGTDTPTDYAALQARAEALDLPALPPAGKCWVQRYAISDRLARRHMLADNRAHDLASYDDRQLAALLTQMAEEGDLPGTGWDDGLDDLLADLRKLDAAARPRAPDEAPEPPDDPITKPGDLIVLGDHKLFCGDSTDPASFMFLLGDERADMVWTDPPYGVDIQEQDLDQAEVRGRRRDGLGVANDDLDEAHLHELLASAFGLVAKSSRPGAALFSSAPGGPLFGTFGRVLNELGIWRHTLIWVKDRFVMGRADYHYRHEPIFYGWIPGAAHHEPPDRAQDTVWEIPRPGRSPEHPTMKPIELVARAIRNHSDPGEVVLDPFAGSGTTLMACEQEARAARCIELDPRYCDVIVARWEKHTGQKAVRP